MSQEDPKNLTLTPISEIRQKTREIVTDGIPMELPSGIVVKLVRPSLAKMLKDGVIPGNLVQASMKQMQGAVPMTEKDIQESLEVVELIVIASVKEPHIVKENPDENSLGIYELTDEDRGFIFQYVQSGATDLTPFRKK